MEVPKTDLLKIISYLDDAARLYDALALLPMQKCSSRAHMIRQIITKYKQKLKDNEQKARITLLSCLPPHRNQPNIK